MRSLITELARLVASTTVSTSPLLEMAGYLGDRLEDAGFVVERVVSPQEPGKLSLIARAGPPGTDGLCLSGHMDVVPVDGQPWSSDPFRLQERDGRLVGRGSADMKGFIAALLHAVEGVDLRRLRRELVVVLTDDEEIGCHGSARVADRLLAEGVSLPSACLIGEPTGFQVMRMHPGHVAVHVDVRGRAAHTSRPDLGCNAIEGAAEVVRVVRDLARELEQECADLPLERPWVTMTVAGIRGGSAINIVPDQCTVEVGYRPLPGTDPLAVFRRLESALRRALGGTGWEAHAHVGAVVPPLMSGAAHPLATLLAAHGAGAEVVAPFATDGGNLARAGAIPVIFGPGRIEVAHRADEWVAAADIARTVPILQALIRGRCEGDDRGEAEGGTAAPGGLGSRASP